MHVPRLKHHNKAGVTLSLKIAVGAANRKVGLPHFKIVSPPIGDERLNACTWRDKLKRTLLDINLLGQVGLSFNYDGKGNSLSPIDVVGKGGTSKGSITTGNWVGGDTLGE